MPLRNNYDALPSQWWVGDTRRLFNFSASTTQQGIRSVASPTGRRYIQFNVGVLQSRLTPRVSVYDVYVIIIHMGARRVTLQTWHG